MKEEDEGARRPTRRPRKGEFLKDDEEEEDDGEPAGDHEDEEHSE